MCLEDVAIGEVRFQDFSPSFSTTTCESTITSKSKLDFKTTEGWSLSSCSVACFHSVEHLLQEPLGTSDFQETDDQPCPKLPLYLHFWQVCVSNLPKAKVEPWKMSGVKENLSKMIDQLRETVPGCSRCGGFSKSLQSWT